MEEQSPAVAVADTPAESGGLPEQTRVGTSERLICFGLGALRWGLVVVLLVSGLRKLLDVEWFGRVLWATGFFSDTLVPLLAWSAPLVEVIAALAVALRRFEFFGLLLSVFLFGAFAGLHTYLHLNGIVVPCGCTGIREELLSGPYHLRMACFCYVMFIASAILCTSSPRARTARGGT